MATIHENDNTNPASTPVVVLTGGGTGGHITPILALAHELKKLEPKCHTIYIGEKAAKFAHLTEAHPDINDSSTIFSGKYRRYYGESWLKKLFDIRTNLLNLRDAFFVAAGIIQAWVVLGRIKPDIVFLKGGYVGVPVGIAAALRNIPIVTHDSDSLPGLANRLISRWAVLHATAMPPNTYSYPQQRTKQVGVLVEHSYQYVTPQMQASYKKELELPENSVVVLVTGGSSGAGAINKAMKQIVATLLNDRPNLHIVHQVGKGKLDDFKGVEHERLHLLEFLSPMYAYLGAADIVVTRASANTLAEIGVQGKAAIVIPSPHLADGHQLRNAEYLAEQKAALVVTEQELPKGLLDALERLLARAGERQDLSQKLQHLSPVDGASKLAALLIEQLKQTP